MGRLIPASTSTFGRLMQEIARLDGVPPNISVRMTTPSPLSTRLTASVIARRHNSGSSWAETTIASICSWRPRICSSAALNSWARRPWVTSTRPIIGKPGPERSRAASLGPPRSRRSIEELKVRGQPRLHIAVHAIAQRPARADFEQTTAYGAGAFKRPQQAGLVLVRQTFRIPRHYEAVKRLTAHRTTRIY